jgi:hypothetical protein
VVPRRNRIFPRASRYAGERRRGRFVRFMKPKRKEEPMPLLLWLLGVPLGIVVLLMLFGVIGF